MTLFQAIILAIIEGLTEFIPVSSTGHMILADALMNVRDKEFAKTFEVVIQLGAILAVALIYIKRFFVGINIYKKLFTAFLPSGITGFLAYQTIKEYLFNPFVVSFALILGGIILVLLDQWTENKKSAFKNSESISYAGALKIGLFQCLSMVPGMSRAAATILGGIFAGFDRKLATEFSFLLAIPTMLAASGYDIYKSHESIGQENLQTLITGGMVAFFFAHLAVKAFIAFVQQYGFRHFGYYRIALGILFIVLSLQTNMQLIP